MAEANAPAVVDPNSFSIMKIGDISQIQEVVETNLGDEDFSPFDLDRITVPAGGGIAWEVPTVNGPESQKEIHGVIVLAKKVRSYWKDSSATDGTPPDCASADGIHGQGDPGGLCKQCPNNTDSAGSRISKSPTKTACSASAVLTRTRSPRP